MTSHYKECPPRMKKQQLSLDRRAWESGHTWTKGLLQIRAVATFKACLPTPESTSKLKHHQAGQKGQQRKGTPCFSHLCISYVFFQMDTDKFVRPLMCWENVPPASFPSILQIQTKSPIKYASKGVRVPVPSILVRTLLLAVQYSNDSFDRL